MRRLLKPFGLALGLFASATLIQSCVADRATGTATPHLNRGTANATLPAVRISEVHYDNTGTDAGESIEISGPAGTSLSGYAVVLYNGNGGAVYNTRALSGTIPATCGDRGVVVLTYPVDGIQNGSPDGIALVNGTTLIEFLSYEGAFAGVGGAANGVVSTDIGVSQPSSEPLGRSLQRSGAGTWAGAANTFGLCNDNDTPPPPAVVASVVVSPASSTVIVGNTATFTAEARDASNNAIAGVAFTWTSTAPAVATVTSAGAATGVAEGDAQIIATAPNGVAGSATLHVDAAPPPPPAGPVHIVEIHYDNLGGDVGEAIEIEGPAGATIAGWSIVLYNQTGGSAYNTRALTGVFPDQCSGRGTLVFNYPVDGIQNGPADGMALMNGSTVVEFLSYEGTLVAQNGPAAGMTSVDIGVSEGTSSAVGRSLQKDAIGWFGPNPSSFGQCNKALDPFVSIATGRANLPVGFEDQMFATLNDGRGGETETTFTWTSETPSLATIDADGVVHADAVGTAILRATAPTGATATASLPLVIATTGAAVYANHVEFGTPTDGNPSDDFIITRPFYTSSFNTAKGIPNWVSFNLEATHIGGGARCDCFTYDPELPVSGRYTTADYTGVGAPTLYHGYPIDRGHLLRSFDRESGMLDNANTFYFSNIIPQAADNNQGPWSALEIYLGDLARFSNKEIFIIAGASGSKGTVKDEGKITIPATTWKVAVILPRDQGLANVDSYDDVEVIAIIMPNGPMSRTTPWQNFAATVDAVEALSGYDLLSLLPDQVEIAVESNTKPPVAVANGPFTVLPNESIAFSGLGSTDPDGDALSYAWTYGDGSTGTGLNAPHAYSAPGTYTITLTVTDTRGLVSTATTTATVQSQAVPLQALRSQVTRNSLAVKIEAAIASIERGDATPAIHQLNAFLNELDAMQKTGRIEAATADAWRAVVNRVTEGLDG
jgi:DNA/RNA endonuclease G (NUC1)